MPPNGSLYSSSLFVSSIDLNVVSEHKFTLLSVRRPHPELIAQFISSRDHRERKGKEPTFGYGGVCRGWDNLGELGSILRAKDIVSDHEK